MNNIKVFNRTADKKSVKKICLYTKMLVLGCILFITTSICAQSQRRGSYQPPSDEEVLKRQRQEKYNKLSTKNRLEFSRDFLGHFILGFVDTPQGTSNPNLKGVAGKGTYTNDQGEHIEIDFSDYVKDFPQRGWEGRDVIAYTLNGHPDPIQYSKQMFHAIRKIHGDPNPNEPEKMRAKANDMKDFLIVMNYAFEQEKDYRRQGSKKSSQEIEGDLKFDFDAYFCGRDELFGGPILPAVISSIWEVEPNFEVPKRFSACLPKKKQEQGSPQPLRPGQLTSVPETCLPLPVSQTGSNTRNVENLASNTIDGIVVGWMLNAIRSQFGNDADVGKAEIACGESVFWCDKNETYVYRGNAWGDIAAKCREIHRKICEHPDEEVIQVYNVLRPSTGSGGDGGGNINFGDHSSWQQLKGTHWTTWPRQVHGGSR